MLKIIYNDVLLWITCALGFQNIAFLLNDERFFAASAGCLLVGSIFVVHGVSGQWKKNRGKLLIVAGVALPSVGGVLGIPSAISFSIMLVLAATGLMIVIIDAHRHKNSANGTPV